MRVLGIDPGSETLGWGVVDGSGSKYALVDFGTVKSNPKAAVFKAAAEYLQRRRRGDGRAFARRAVGRGHVLRRQCRRRVKARAGSGLMLLLAEQRGIEIAEYAPRLCQTNGRRLRQRRKAAGTGNGQDTFENENSADAARRG